MTARVPEFGIRETPAWPNAFFIGAAAGSIHPATGNSLGMAITGGLMAADMALDGNAHAYPAAWCRRYRARLHWGHWLHRVMTQPGLSRAVITLSNCMPGLPRFIFERTR